MHVLPAILLLAAAPAPAPANFSSDEAAIHIASAAKLADANNCVAAMAELKSFLGPGVAETLDPQQGQLALSVGALCELRAKRYPEAHAYALRATQPENVSELAWRIRFFTEMESKDNAAAVVTLERVADGNGAILNKFDNRWLWQLNAQLVSAEQRELRQRFLKIVAQSYDPDPLAGSADAFRQMYATALNEAGRPEDARAVLVGVKSPAVLRLIMLDARLRDALPARFDIRAATNVHWTNARSDGGRSRQAQRDAGRRGLSAHVGSRAGVADAAGERPRTFRRQVR